MTGEMIRVIRKTYNDSQREFGARCGVAKNTVARWERGEKRPGGPAKKVLEILARRKRLITSEYGL